ncbi:SGNH/GDSL hydrolase family protein [Vibrio parahaemolyticus]|nr:SGNH/GDSL hydrolase family protein [Vibrio parahaemolyticus]
MHPLRNGSQQVERPARKPFEGLAGYFTESGENNIPSFPGADWFNDNIDEFLNLLNYAGVEFDPEKTDHFVKAFESIKSSFPNVMSSVSDLEASTHLVSGDSVITLKYVSEILCTWEIVSTEPTGNWYVSTSNGLWAKLVEFDYDIRRYGGSDDYDGVDGTNNKAAIDYLIGKRPITIKMPRTRTGTGVYLYDGTLSQPSTDYKGVVLEVEDGVSIHSTGLNNGEFWRKNVKYNREVKSRVGGARYDLYAGPHQYARPSEQFSRMTHSDGNLGEVRLIDFSADYVRCYELSSWPSGSLNEISPASATVPDIDLGTIPEFSFKMAGVPVAPGDFVQANVESGTVRPCVFVETSGGWVIIQQPPISSGFTKRLNVQFSNGFSFDYDDDMFKQSEYRFDRASLGIIVYDAVSFGVCVNGIVVRRIDTSAVGSIQVAGWGAGYDDTRSMVVNRPSAFYGKKSIGIKPLKIVGVGDSTSADTLPPSQYQYMKQYLAGSCGAQVWDLKNLAVGGNTSAQQLSALQSADISNYDYCCIQIGINDVQGSVPSLTLLANIEAMIDVCEANNVIPIIGLPTQWYSQSDAQLYGQDGQNTGNSVSAPRYRNVVMHGLGVRGGVLMNTSVLEDEGAVLAELLSKPELDPIQQDNIHPTAHAQMAMGMSYAKAIIGHLAGFSLSNNLLSMPSYWFSGAIGSNATPKFSFKDGLVTVSYYISRNSVTINNGDVIGNIPERFRPSSTALVPCICTTGNSETPTTQPNAQLLFHEDGRIVAHNIDNTCTFISVSASWNCF